MITDADIGNAFSENFIGPCLKWIINVVSKEMGLSFKFTPLIIYFSCLDMSSFPVWNVYSLLCLFPQQWNIFFRFYTPQTTLLYTPIRKIKKSMKWQNVLPDTIISMSFSTPSRIFYSLEPTWGLVVPNLFVCAYDKNCWLEVLKHLQFLYHWLYKSLFKFCNEYQMKI